LEEIRTSNKVLGRKGKNRRLPPERKNQKKMPSPGKSQMYLLNWRREGRGLIQNVTFEKRGRKKKGGRMWVVTTENLQSCGMTKEWRYWE